MNIRSKIAFAAALVALGTTAGAATWATSGSARVVTSIVPPALVPNGPVSDVVSFGGLRIIAGSFTRIGKQTGPAVLVADTGERKAFPTFVGGTVTAIVSDGSGGWFVGGSFRYANAVPRRGLAHVLPDGRLDPAFRPDVAPNSDVVWIDDPPDLVAALAVSGGRLYVGGSFTSIDGTGRRGLAAFDVASGALSSWAADVDIGGSVNALAVAADRLYVGGLFAHVAGVPRSGLTAVDATTGAVLPWSPNPNGRVNAIAATPAAVYVGGSFVEIAGEAHRFLAGLDATSGAARDWPEAGAPGEVTALLADGSSLYAGMRVAPRHTGTALLAIHNAPASPPSALTADGSVRALAKRDGTLYVGGGFHTFDGKPHLGVATFGGVTAAEKSWNPEPNLFVGSRFGNPEAAVRALVATDRGVAIGGDFAAIGGTARRGLAAFDPSSGAPRVLRGWNPHPDGDVTGLAVAKRRLYVVGSFKHIDGKPRNGAAAYTDSVGFTKWRPPALKPPGMAQDVTVVGNKVIVTGYFNGVAGKRGHGSIAAFDPGSGRLLDWGPKIVGNGVRQILAAGGRVYAVGVAGTTSTVALLDPKTGRVRRYLFSNQGNGDVYAIALRGRTLYLGGAMQAINGRPVARLAAVDAVTGAVLPWHVDVDESVFSLTLVGNTLYVGGQFEHVNGVPRRGLAAVDATTGTVLPWERDQTLDGYVSRTGRYGEGIFAAGEFLSVGLAPQPFVTFLP